MTNANANAVSAASASDKFLTPEAMVTPGVAGALTALISDRLFTNFGIPPAHVGLALSFLLGLLVLVANRRWYERAIYYVVNSLIIFCVAFGAGSITQGSGKDRTSDTQGWLFPSVAYAQESTATQPVTPPGVPSTPGNESLRQKENPWQSPFSGPDSIFKCPFGLCAPQASRVSTERDTDRRGGDYANLDISDLESCQAACEADTKCKAYTFVPPGYTHSNWSGPTPRCWLKSWRPRPTPWDGLISGTRRD